MKILFVTHPYPNYVPDLLLHGFRKILGTDVIDYPKKESLYRGELMGVSPDDQRSQWFPPDDGKIDRLDLPSKVASGYFRYIICDVRAFTPFRDFLNRLPDWPSGLVLVDGEDIPARIQPGQYVVCRREADGTDYSIPLQISLPEEILQWIASYDNEEKSYSVGFLGSTHPAYDIRTKIIEEISSRYPDSLLKVSDIPSEDDPNPSGRVGRDEYYKNLQKCRIVLNLRGAGYDTFRYWENAACNAVHIAQRMPIFIPNDFKEGKHILRFSTVDEVVRMIDHVLDAKLPDKQIAERSREHLRKYHLTTRRAEYLLERLGKIFA